MWIRRRMEYIQRQNQSSFLGKVHIVFWNFEALKIMSLLFLFNLIRPQTTRTSSSKLKKNDSIEQQSKNTSDDVASTNITIIQVSSANVKEKLSQTQSECTENKIEATTANFMNSVQIIPSNYTTTEQNAIVTVQVTNDSNAALHMNDELPSSASKAVASNKNGIVTAVAIASDGHKDFNNGRKFGAVTNISIGEQQQQQLQSATIESHYEQVFIMHTPANVSDSATCNLDQTIDHIQPKINRIKVDSVHTEVRPSTSAQSAGVSIPTSVTAPSSSSASASATASTSVAAITSSGDSNALNLINNKSKDAIKNRSVENNAENDTSLLCRRPLLSRGLTEAVIMRQSRKDVNMLLNRINPQGNHVRIPEAQFYRILRAASMLCVDALDILASRQSDRFGMRRLRSIIMYSVISLSLFRLYSFFCSAHRLSFTQTLNNVIRLNSENEAHPHLIRNEIVAEQIIIMLQPGITHTSIITIITWVS